MIAYFRKTVKDINELIHDEFEIVDSLTRDKSD